MIIPYCIALAIIYPPVPPATAFIENACVNISLITDFLVEIDNESVKIKYCVV